MPVHVPGRRLMHSVPLRFVQHKVTGGGKRGVNAGLNLVSMIDFLVTVLVFLLMSFNASGEINVPKEIRLPYAVNADEMMQTTIVAVAKNSILVNGAEVGTTRMVEEANQVKRIEELFNKLKSIRETFKQTNPGAEFPGVVVLQLDQDVPAVVVKSVFQTAAFAGFPRISFMINKLGGPSDEGGEGGHH